MRACGVIKILYGVLGCLRFSILNIIAGIKPNTLKMLALATE